MTNKIAKQGTDSVDYRAHELAPTALDAIAGRSPARFDLLLPFPARISDARWRPEQIRCVVLTAVLRDLPARQAIDLDGPDS